MGVSDIDARKVDCWLRANPKRHWLDHLIWWIAIRLPLRNRLTKSDRGEPYLLRFYLWHGWGPHVYLHYFFRSDYDREVHNHPWARMASLILTGGYREERTQISAGPAQWTIKTYRPGRVNVLGKSDFHRVDLLGVGCWTLFVSWKRRRRERSWGFWNPLTKRFEWSEDREARKATS